MYKRRLLLHCNSCSLTVFIAGISWSYLPIKLPTCIQYKAQTGVYPRELKMVLFFHKSQVAPGGVQGESLDFLQCFLCMSS